MRTGSLTAIDVHVHVESDGRGCYSMDDELLAASARYFRADHDRTPTLEQIADKAREHADVLIPFGSVDPLRCAISSCWTSSPTSAPRLSRTTRSPCWACDDHPQRRLFVHMMSAQVGVCVSDGYAHVIHG